MNNIDDMMTIWKEMDSKLTFLVDENKKLVDKIKKDKLKSKQEKLIAKYRGFIVMEGIGIPLILLAVGLNPLIIEKYRWPTLIYFICFFLLEICIDAFLLYKLNRIDIYNDSITNISRQAKTNWKTHKIAVLIGIPIAVGAVALISLAVGANKAFLYGIFVGGAIGVALGLNEFLKFMKNYKSMTKDE